MIFFSNSYILNVTKSAKLEFINPKLEVSFFFFVTITFNAL